MTNYGLTNYQINKAYEKLKYNKEFMSRNGIQLDDKLIPFADFVANSYINSDRYIAELQHRAWSIYEYAEEKNLKNIFLTLTLPTEWHKKKTFKNKLINNKKFGGRKYITTIKKIKFLNCNVTQNIPFIEPILDFTDTIDKYTSKNASKELSKLLKKFFDDRAYKNIDKKYRCYFRVTEPHKNGTPHIHMSLYVPNDRVDSIVKALNRLFPSPQSKIETDINSPVAYLMKYVLKTLDDLRGESDITNLTLWYLFHGISRFYTSRTFVSLEVYRKLNGMYTLRDLTKDYLTEDLSIFIDTSTNKIAKIENQHGIIYTPKPVNWYDKLIDTDHTYLEAEFESMYKPNEIKKPIDILINGEEFIFHNHNLKELNKDNEKLQEIGIEPISFSSILIKPKKQPYQMNDYELYTYYENLDIETVDYKHYAYTCNLLIDRGYEVGERLKLSSLEDITKEFESEVF